MARKPLSGTVLRNVEQWGVGALNIDGSRLPVVDDEYARNCSGDRGYAGERTRQLDGFAMTAGSASEIGRWPPNVALDEDAAAALDHAVGDRRSGANPTRRSAPKHRNLFGDFAGQPNCIPQRSVDVGGPSRFFYCPKPSRKERNAGLLDGTLGSGLVKLRDDLTAEKRAWVLSELAAAGVVL